MKRIVGFGEIMGRLAPEGFERFSQACPGRLDLTFAGAEANVAASVSLLGGRSAFVTALPRHEIAEACIRSLKALDIDTSHIVRTDYGRLGLYFVETGANQRPSTVIYDRSGSAISRTPPEAYNWEAIFTDAGWLHLSGITPALSRQAAEAAHVAAVQAKAAGLTVSCDLNFRQKLWRWEDGTDPKALARRCMRAILPAVDVVFANEGDAEDVLGIVAEGSHVEGGQLDTARYPEVARRIVADFPHVRQVAITLRESHSASHNDWGALFYDTATDQAHFAPERNCSYTPYPIRNIVDRVGAGDSFGAGLIFALNQPELQAPETAVRFAVAASCLAHSIEGDFNFSTRAEVERLMGGNASGRVIR